jgi:hypothetical protein
MNKVILSMTTVPVRLFDPQEDYGIRPGLKTLLQQSDTSYEIHLNVPFKYKTEYIKIPEWLLEWQRQYSHLKVFRCDDLGPITKIYPTIKRVTDPTTVIITVDDDLIYMNGFIRSHLEARKRYPEYAIGYAGLGSIDESKPADDRGVHPTGKYHFTTSTPEDVRVRMIEGYKTVSYTRAMFTEDFDDFVGKHWNDDITISAYLGYKNIKKIVLKCENCEGDYSPRVETFPVVCHAPISGEVHGCNSFRRNESIVEQMEKVSNQWYNLGYLER